MTTVKIAELKDNLSKHLRQVERGATVEVTDRGRPIARIVPIEQPRRQITILPAKRPFSEVRSKRYPHASWPVDVLEILREERADRFP